MIRVRSPSRFLLRISDAGVGDNLPLPISLLDDNQIIALDYPVAKGHVVSTRIVSEVPRPFRVQAVDNLIVCTPADRSLELHQNGVAAVHRAVPAHQHSFGRVESS